MEKWLANDVTSEMGLELLDVAESGNIRRSFEELRKVVQTNRLDYTKRQDERGL